MCTLVLPLLAIVAPRAAQAQKTIPSLANTSGGDTVYHDDLGLTASATLQDIGPIQNEPIHFNVGSFKCTGVTDANGFATCQLVRAPLPLKPGTYTITARFDGNQFYDPTSADATLLVDVGDSFIRVLSSPTSIPRNSKVTLQFRLEEGEGDPAQPPGAPIRGRVTATITAASGASQSCSARTATNGTGKCSITVTLPPGPASITFRYPGSALYDFQLVGAPPATIN
jgi:hypothetical protein